MNSPASSHRNSLHVPKCSVAWYVVKFGGHMPSLFLSLGLNTQHHKAFHIPKTDSSSHHSQRCLQPSGQHQFGKSKGEKVAPLFLSLQRKPTVTSDDVKQAPMLSVSMQTSPSEVLISRGILFIARQLLFLFSLRMGQEKCQNTGFVVRCLPLRRK